MTALQPRRRKKAPYNPAHDRRVEQRERNGDYSQDARGESHPCAGSGVRAVLQFPREPQRPGLDIRVVERRVHRACRTIRALPDAEAKFFNMAGCWPDVVQSVEEAYGYTEATMPRFRPTPFDVSDVLTALGWAKGLEKREFRLIWWRAFDYSFGWIGRRIGRSDETARRRYKDAMLRVWGEANAQHLGVGA